MAFKDIWINKIDDVDDVLADDINSIAQEVIRQGEEIKNMSAYDDTEIRNNISIIQTDILNLQDHKADKTIIITDTEATEYIFEFSSTHNTEKRLAEVANISFIFGNGEYNADYTSGLSFDSGATPTAIDYTDSGILNWVGTDCVTSDGLSIFQPSANTHYDIVFYFNGVQFIGLVNGFVPATGNEAI